MTSKVRPGGSSAWVLATLASAPLLACRAAEPSSASASPIAAGSAELLSAPPQEAAAPPPEAPAGEGDRSEGAGDRPPEASAASHFSTRDPIYFVVGFRGRTNAKFQISFKYRVIEPEDPLAHSSPLWQELYFGFGTTTLWNLEAESTPFFDSVYRPSLFWLRERIESFSSDSLDVGAELGVEHQSNGQGGDASRSLNIVYAKPMWTWAFDEELRFSVQPKVWTYVGDLGDNPDIADFRGYFNLCILGYDTDGLGISTEVGVGDAFDRASLQLDVSYPMSKLFDKLGAYLHLQYFTGWGESLGSYDEKAPSQIRIGVMLAR